MYTCIHCIRILARVHLQVHVHVCIPPSPLHTYLQESPFGSLWYSMMTIIVYTVGGPDNIMLDLDDEWSNDYFLFPVVSYILWIVFIVAMSVLFLNLLVLLYSHNTAVLIPHARGVMVFFSGHCSVYMYSDHVCAYPQAKASLYYLALIILYNYLLEDISKTSKT